MSVTPFRIENTHDKVASSLINSQKVGVNEKSCKYEGQYLNSKKHGIGKLTIQNMFIYEGEFVNDKMEGFGKKTWINNYRIYVGEFKNDEPHGKGILTFFNGDVYEGEFMNGDCQGYGIFKFAHLIYEGEFDNGTFHGKGNLRDKIKENVVFDNDKIK